jgi:sigma-B regulation protein RsbQ
VLVGHSLSAIAGAVAAAQDPGLFSRLVLINGTARYANDPATFYIGGFTHEAIDATLRAIESDFVGWSDAMAPVIMGNEDRPELSQELVTSFCSMDRSIARRWARAIFLGDNRDDLPRVNVPTLVMQSVDDAIAPLSVGEYVHARLPQGTLHVMKASGHCPHMSDPDEVLEVMGAYLARHGL